MSFLKKLFSNSKPGQPAEPIFPGESFSIAKLNFPEGWGLATYNAAYRDYGNKKSFPWLVLIELGINSPNENGHPSDDDATQLIIQEENILRFLQQKHTVHFVARITRPGIRELLYYTDHPKFVQEEVHAFCDNIMLERPINFNIEKDPEWKAVSGFIG